MKVMVGVEELVSREARMYVRANGDLVCVEIRHERIPSYTRRFHVAAATTIAMCLSGGMEQAEVTADGGQEYVIRHECSGAFVVYEKLSDSRRVRRLALNESGATAITWALQAAVVKAMEGEQ